MKGLNCHHKIPKGMGGSGLRDGGWNRSYMRWKDHMGTHHDGNKMKAHRAEAGDRLLRQLHSVATAGLVGEGEIRLALGWTREKDYDTFLRLKRQLVGGPYWPVEDVARAIMGGKLYASEMI